MAHSSAQQDAIEIINSVPNDATATVGQIELRALAMNFLTHSVVVEAGRASDQAKAEARLEEIGKELMVKAVHMR
jgi:hypothetical protein